MHRVSLLLVLAACGTSSKSEPAPAGTLVDQGVIVTTIDGKPAAKETFSIHQVGEQLVIRAHSATLPGSARPSTQEGVLETDLHYRPRSLTYHYAAPTDGFRYTLGGNPLALDRTRDDGKNPEHIVATGAVDVFVEGPGLIGMAAACQFDAPTTIPTLSDFESGYKGKVVIKSVEPLGKLRRLKIKFLDEFEVELYCDGERFVASGLRSNKLWNVREGREAEFAVARDAKP
jgi:hypothetical protein